MSPSATFILFAVFGVWRSGGATRHINELNAIEQFPVPGPDCENCTLSNQEREEMCVRTKPYWLGTVQGIVTLVRYAVFGVGGCCGLLGSTLNCLFEVIELVAMFVDIVVQKSYWLDVVVGDNSLLEIVELGFAMASLQGYIDDQESDKSVGMILAGVLKFFYAVRLLVLMVALKLFFIGNLVYPFAIIGAVFLLVCCGPILVHASDSAQQDRLFGEYAVVGLGLGVLVLILQFAEMAGIAGWHLIQGRAIPKHKRWVKHLVDTYKCGNLKNWIRNKLDWVIMMASIL